MVPGSHIFSIIFVFPLRHPSDTPPPPPPFPPPPPSTQFVLDPTFLSFLVSLTCPFFFVSWVFWLEWMNPATSLFPLLHYVTTEFTIQNWWYDTPNEKKKRTHIFFQIVTQPLSCDLGMKLTHSLPTISHVYAFKNHNVTHNHINEWQFQKQKNFFWKERKKHISSGFTARLFITPGTKLRLATTGKRKKPTRQL